MKVTNKKLIVLLWTICITSICYSQSIFISSFRLLDTDLTANTAGTMEIDQNGETAALIKVVTTQIGFTFDGGSLGIVKTKQTPGEIWVYVPRGSKKISIKHPQLGVLRDYYFPIAIDAARTYEMVLTTGEVQTVVRETAHSQYLVIHVSPADAVIELNNELLPVSDGIAQKFLKLGTYDYRIQALNYHTSAGKVTIDNPNEKKVLNVNLQPAFGWIEIGNSEELYGSQVYIDNSLIGTAPLKSHNLASGEHSVKIVKALYHSYEDIVNVRDNETTTITPSLTPDFSTVTITVDNDADIYINDELKGHGTWTGKIGTGTYMFEAKKDNHRTTTTLYDISSNQNDYIIHLEAPTPILGEINITSNPNMSDIYIDGKPYGQTPLYIPDILVGSHELIVKHKGYGDYKSNISIEENKTFELEATLNNIVSVTIVCTHPTADLYIDGKPEGIAQGIKKLEIGVHRIEVKPKAYEKVMPYDENINIDGTKEYIYITLESKKPIKIEPKQGKFESKQSIYSGSVNVSFSSDRPNTYLIVDDKIISNTVSKTPITKELSIGIHEIKFRCKGNNEIVRIVDFNSTQNNFYVSFKNREVYLIK